MKNRLDTQSKLTVSERFIEQLYSMESTFTDEEGKGIEIPKSGFLGLLATGYRGTVMLRRQRGQTHLYKKFTKGRHRRPKRVKPVKKD